MLRIIKVKGDSLSPEYKEGAYVVITTIPFFFDSLNSGDTIVFHHPVYGTMVKQTQSIDPQSGELLVVGTHPQSTDSRHFGPIPKDWLTGKVLWHIPKPR